MLKIGSPPEVKQDQLPTVGTREIFQKQVVLGEEPSIYS